MKIAVLTGGGDCAGPKAVIRAVVKRAEDGGDTVIGIRRGWAGLLDLDTVELHYDEIDETIRMGGTILKTSRKNPYKIKDGPEKVAENLHKMGVDGLIAIGGDDTLGVANKLWKDKGIKVVGVPKTIDNDLSGTDVTFGFYSAVDEAMRMIDNIYSTGKSHDRVMVVEVMGRHAGWIALVAGIASGAHLILTPEKPFKIGDVIEFVKKRHGSGKTPTVIVIAEGTPIEGKVIAEGAKVDEFGHVRMRGVGKYLAERIEEATEFEVRDVVLGHVIRGGSPNAFDRFLCTRLGVAAVDCLRSGKYGVMVALRGMDIVPIPLEEAVGKLKTVPEELLELTEIFKG
ncbi:MAG TPA: 6-phosphofructokinase [Candidatus Bathyarchaeota archaeon]|nr:6-phosphofructokinase [Candidatus Bathyarchaeota archaeon]